MEFYPTFTTSQFICKPYYKQFGFKKGQFKNSEKYGENALSIPIYPDLSLKDQKKNYQNN